MRATWRSISVVRDCWYQQANKQRHSIAARLFASTDDEWDKMRKNELSKLPRAALERSFVELVGFDIDTIDGTGKNGRVLKDDLVREIFKLEKELLENGEEIDFGLENENAGISAILPFSLSKNKGQEKGKSAVVSKKILSKQREKCDSASHPPKLTGALLGVGGLDSIIDKLNEQLYLPLIKAATASARLDVDPPKGILLHGPPGCGKSLLASRLATILSPHRPPEMVKGPEILNPFFGNTEHQVRELFEPPYGKNHKLKVVILDEADVILERRGMSLTNRNMESVVAQFLACMDGAAERSKLDRTKRVLFIATTNRPDAIDPALLRPGRFSLCLEFPSTPSLDGRLEILQLETRVLRQNKALSAEAEDFLTECAHVAYGFSGADLSGLVNGAKMKALQRCARLGQTEQEQAALSVEDLMEALRDQLQHMGQEKRLELLTKRMQHDTERGKGG